MGSRPIRHHVPNGLTRELREAVPALDLPERDVRAARPLLLRGLLRFESLRRATRVLVLAALDVIGLLLAIETALLIKALVRTPDEVHRTLEQTRDIAPLAALMMLLLFARSGLYRDRGQRPGFAKVIASLVEVTVVMLLYAKIQGFDSSSQYSDFNSYYIFYGSLLFALVFVSGLRWLFERVSGALLRAAGYRRRTVLVGTGSHLHAVAHALQQGSQLDPFGYVSLSPQRVGGLRDFGSLENLERHFDSVDEVLIADPRSPRTRRSSWSIAATATACACAWRPRRRRS
jgi:FlaA1/EpsC-like NDP-sugar epimerase